MTLPTLAELNGMPEHCCDAAAHAGDPCSQEAAIELVNVIAKALEALIRGGYLNLDEANEMFRKLCDHIAERRKSGHA